MMRSEYNRFQPMVACWLSGQHWLSLFFLLLLLPACKEDPEQEQAVLAIELNASEAVVVNGATVYLPQAGGTFTMTVSSNRDWTLQGSADWCKASVRSGRGNAVVTLVVVENKATQSRMLTLSVSSKDVTPCAVQVEQLGAEPFLQVSGVRALPQIGGSLDLMLQSNLRWSLAVDAPWCLVDPLSGEGNYLVNVMAETNTVGISRSAMLVVTGRDLAGAVQVVDTVAIQQFGERPVILPIDTVFIDDLAQEITVAVQTNIAYEVTIEAVDNWLTQTGNVKKTATLVDWTLTLAATANTEETARTATITLSADTTVVSFVVVQAIAPCDECGIGRLEGIPLLGYGQPVDRRQQAREHIEAARQQLRALNWPYDYDILGVGVDQVALLYPETRRLYANARRMGEQKIFQYFIREGAITNCYDYLSDTVIIYSCGGPDFRLGVDDAYGFLWARKFLGGDNTDYDSHAYILGSSWMMDRPYNLSHTSIIEVPHGSAGLLPPLYTNREILVRFFDYEAACGNGETVWPYNMLSYEDAGLVNDISVELLRNAVELLKQQGKTIVFFGTSWGGYIMARYLLYYPIEDFDRVVLSGFNPNCSVKATRKIRNQMNDKEFSAGKMVAGVESYEMQRWRMVPWFTKHDLSRLRIICGNEDERVGFPTTDELKALTEAGATVVEEIGCGHGLKYYPLSVTDTVIRFTWEDNMRIHTQHGVQEVHNVSRAAARKVAVPVVPEKETPLPPQWKVLPKL